MNVEDLRAYCLEKRGTTESFPFDAVTLVLKVSNKMFAIIPLERSNQIALKCNPERAMELREEWEEITAAYHMNKQHWNTVNCETGLSNKLLQELIDHSYNLIVKSLPKKIQAELESLG